MNTEEPTQVPRRGQSWIRWIVWTGLMLIGGMVLLVIFGVWQSLTENGSSSGTLLVVVFLAIYFVGFFCLRSATRPTRGRAEERQSWKERFPEHREQQLERFLQVVIDELGLRKVDWCRLRPDDRLRDLTQEWLCGDGLDIIELFMAVEGEYGFELPETFHESDTTLGDLFAYVTERSPQLRLSATPEEKAKAKARAEQRNAKSTD